MLVVVVIPALDEEGNIGDVVRALHAERIEQVIVVDNGSTDGTAHEAESAGAVVISEPRKGYGSACAAGTEAALEAGAGIVVYIDADQSSRPNEIGTLIDPIANDQADLVLGSRTLGAIADGAMGSHQRVGNIVSAGLMRLLYRIEVTDLGPYRAIRAGLIRDLDMTEMTFGWPTEMMVKTARADARIVEVPVSWDVRQEGESKVGGTVKGSILAGFHILRVTLRHSAPKFGAPKFGAPKSGAPKSGAPKS